jgi:hypothetical protein
VSTDSSEGRCSVDRMTISQMEIILVFVVVVVCFCFETGPCYVAQADLKHTHSLSLSLSLSFRGEAGLGLEPRASHLQSKHSTALPPVLKLSILLSEPPECWDYIGAPPCLSLALFVTVKNGRQHR